MKLSTFSKYGEVLEILGLELSRKDMIILSALLKAQESPSDYIDFKTLREQLTKEEGSEKGADPLIYRSLSRLENQGFLKIDKSGHKHGYSSNIDVIEKALKKKIAKKIRLMEKDLKDIDNTVTVLSDLNSDAVAIDMIDLMVGKRKIEKPVFVEGWDNFMKMINDKVFNGIKRGDVIRITLEWVVQHDYLNPSTLKMTESLLKEGVEFRSLDHDRGEKVIRVPFRQTIPLWRQKGYKAGYRILPKKEATYQFVGRNSEGIALIVSEQPLSITWVPRGSNPELVDNAIEYFDRDYEAGIDILEYEE
jgi:hypothetical protein